MRAQFDLEAIEKLSPQQLAAVRAHVAARLAALEPCPPADRAAADAPAVEEKASAADLFAVPPPLPDPAVGRRERRKVRRKAKYWALLRIA